MSERRLYRPPAKPDEAKPAKPKRTDRSPWDVRKPEVTDPETRSKVQMIEQARDKFREWLRQFGLSEQSIKVYSRVFSGVLESRKTPAEWVKWALEGKPPGTANPYTVGARYAHRFLGEIGHPLAGEYPEKPVSKKKKQEIVQRYALSKEQLAAYLAAVDRAVTDLDARIILHLIPLTGLRISEACWLRLTDIGVRRSGAIGLIVAAGKGNKERWIPLPPEARKLIASYQSQRRSGSKYLFPSKRRYGAPIAPNRIREYHQKALADLPEPFKAELADMKVHSLRHTYASRLIARGAPLVAVRDLLGHATVQTTEIYTHSLPQSLAQIANGMWDD